MKSATPTAGLFLLSEATYPRLMSLTETFLMLNPTLSPGVASASDSWCISTDFTYGKWEVNECCVPISQSNDFNRGPRFFLRDPWVSQVLSFTGGVKSARALHVLNLIRFGYIARLSLWGGGGWGNGNPDPGAKEAPDPGSGSATCSIVGSGSKSGSVTGNEAGMHCCSGSLRQKAAKQWF